MFIDQERLGQARDILRIAKEKGGQKEQLMAVINDAFELLANGFELPSYDASINDAVGTYVELRDRLAVDRHAWEEHELRIKDHVERISMWLRDKGDELGTDSFSTPSGTAYRAVKESYRIESWPTYSAWILKTGNIHCLERRPAKLACKEIFEELGELPEGLTRHEEVEFLVRRPTKKKA